MLTSQAVFTSSYDGTVYCGDNLELAPWVSEIFINPEYSERARIFLAIELILEGISRTKPPMRIQENNFVISALFDASLQDFLNQLAVELRKHFKNLSHLFGATVLTMPDNKLRLQLTFPEKIINQKWDEAQNTKNLGTNQSHYVSLAAMIQRALGIAQQKLDDDSDINAKMNSYQIVVQLLRIARKVQPESQESIVQATKTTLTKLLEYCQINFYLAHGKVISSLPEKIKGYFNFDCAEDENLLLALLAECVVKSQDLLALLQHKNMQPRLAGESHRLPILISDQSSVHIDFHENPELVLVLTNSSGLEAEQRICEMHNCAIRTEFYDSRKQIHVLFLTQLNTQILDLHKVSAPNAKKLFDQFIKFHFFNYTFEPMVLDVGENKSTSQAGRLSVLVTRMLKNVEKEMPGLLTSTPYNQQTGHITVQLKPILKLQINANTVNELMREFKNDSLPSNSKKFLYDQIKEQLNSFSAIKHNLTRVMVEFETQPKSELKEYLKAHLMQKLPGLIKNSSIVWDQHRAGLEFLVVPNSALDFIPRTDRFVIPSRAPGFEPHSPRFV